MRLIEGGGTGGGDDGAMHAMTAFQAASQSVARCAAEIEQIAEAEQPRLYSAVATLRTISRCLSRLR